MTQKYYSSEEAAKALGVSEDDVKQMAQRQELHGYRDGPRWKFKAEDIEQLVQQRAAQPERYHRRPSRLRLNRRYAEVLFGTEDKRFGSPQQVAHGLSALIPQHFDLGASQGFKTSGLRAGSHNLQREAELVEGEYYLVNVFIGN